MTTLSLSGRYPPTIQQRGIVAMSSNNSRAVSYYTLKLAFLVTPRIDLRRLERTFAKLAGRHDALRQSFERQGDDWFVNVWNRHRTGVVVEDHGDISDADFSALLRHHSYVPIELLDDVLFQVVVLRCGQRGDVLFIRCHHAIVDAHSMIVLTDDWLRLLIGIPLHGRGVTHEEFLLEQSNLSPRANIDNHKYWEQLLLPALPNPGSGEFGKPGKWPRTVYRTDTLRSNKFSLASAEFNGIPTTVNARAQTSYAVVLAAFADTVIELSGLPGIYVCTAVDRTSNRLRDFVGCAVVTMPIRCHAAKGMAFAEYAANLASQIKRSLDHLPSEAAWYDSEFDFAIERSGGVLRHFACNMAFPVARARGSPFSSGIMAQLETPQKVGSLTVTRLGIASADYSFHGLRLRIAPHKDQTEFELQYHVDFYTEADVERLRSALQEKLHVPR